MIAEETTPTSSFMLRQSIGFHINGCNVQQGRRLLDRFKPGKFPHMLDMNTARSNGSSEILLEVVRVSFAPQLRSRSPGSLPPLPTRAFNYLRSELLILDNGLPSVFQVPRGEQRDYSNPRKYEVDLNAKIATEVWNFEQGQKPVVSFCGSVYEDGPLNYLIDYHLKTPLDKTRTRTCSV